MSERVAKWVKKRSIECPSWVEYHLIVGGLLGKVWLSGSGCWSAAVVSMLSGDRKRLPLSKNTEECAREVVEDEILKMLSPTAD